MFKKIVSVILIIACIFALAACGSAKSYEYGPVSGGANASDAVVGNGSFAVQKGNYIYFINSSESTSATNEFNSGVAGVICRANLDGTNATVIFPKLVTNASQTGLYVLGDRIYFTSPCDEINSKGEVQSSYLDILSVKLDGTDAKKHATLGASTYPMVFMEDNGSVYALYVKESVMYSLNLSAKKPTSETLVEKYTSYVFADNVVYYSMLAYVEGSDSIADRYTEVFAITAGGEKTKLFDGNSNTNVKYKYSLKKLDNGKLYYEKTDSVLTLEDSLVYREANNASVGAETKVLTNYIATFFNYNYNGVSGLIVSDSTLGTNFVGNDGTVKKISSSALTITGVVNNYVYYTTTTESAATLFRYDVAKILTAAEDVKTDAEQVLFMSSSTDSEGKETKTYDAIYASNFKTYTVINGNLYYFSNAGAKVRNLYKWDFTTNAPVLVSVAA